MTIDFGKGIRLARVARGKTQAELAAAASLNKNYVSLLEGGHRAPSVEALASIAIALDVPLWLIVLLGSPPEEAGKAAAKMGPEVLLVLTR